MVLPFFGRKIYSRVHQEVEDLKIKVEESSPEPIAIDTCAVSTAILNWTKMVPAVPPRSDSKFIMELSFHHGIGLLTCACTIDMERLRVEPAKLATPSSSCLLDPSYLASGYNCDLATLLSTTKMHSASELSHSLAPSLPGSLTPLLPNSRTPLLHHSLTPSFPKSTSSLQYRTWPQRTMRLDGLSLGVCATNCYGLGNAK